MGFGHLALFYSSGCVNTGDVAVKIWFISASIEPYKMSKKERNLKFLFQQGRWNVKIK